MRKRGFGKHLRDGAVVTTTILGLVASQSGMAQPAPSAPSGAAQAASSGGSFGPNSRDGATKTPIKHVIIIIGENRTFDNVFATYQPKSGETVWNLLSEGIVNPDGAPGPNYKNALQYSASNYDSFQLAPLPKTPYAHCCPPSRSAAHATPYGCQLIGITTSRTLADRLQLRPPTWRR